MSVITIGIVLFFAYFEFAKYFHPPLTREVILAQGPVSSQQSTFPINFDISFYKVPCRSI